MFGIQISVRAFPGIRILSDLPNENRLVPSSFPSCLLKVGLTTKQCRGSNNNKLFIISCKSYRGSSPYRSNNNDERDRDDYIEATLLLPETIHHYHMRRDGFQEESTKWQSSRQLFPFSFPAKGPTQDVNTVAQGLLHRFQSPTMFLKVSCDGDFLLPIIVGESAIERLIDASSEDKYVDYPDQFQFLRTLVAKLGYEVNMVRITERVSSTYIARIYFIKPGEKDVISVDARPSDAINVAKRCKASIYVSKEVVLTDAIRITYGMGRLRSNKSIYDVTLDSPEDGPDILAKELELVNNMKLAIFEERYRDAAICRDKLMKLRESGHGS